MIRTAQAQDLPRIVDLADRKRLQYRGYAPVFYRPHTDARARHRPFLDSLINSSRHIALVNDAGGDVNGFVVASLLPPPPVYDPGGASCLIDDFMVAAPNLWVSVGHELLDEACRQAKELGAVQSIVVCGPRDEAKRAMLLAAGHIVASEWLTRPFDP